MDENALNGTLNRPIKRTMDGVHCCLNILGALFIYFADDVDIVGGLSQAVTEQRIRLKW